MQRFVVFLALAFLATPHLSAQDWNGIPIPVNPPSGKSWQLNSVSDSFNYTSSAGNRPSAFTNRWNARYINGWTGPSLTRWDAGHVWSNGNYMAMQAHSDPNSNKILMGCMSSKATFTYPLFLEARVWMSNLATANNIWMLSADETEEIDVLEAYPSDRSDMSWLDQRIHLSHHVFIRNPFQDYQPRDEEGVFGTWYRENGRSTWRGGWVRIGIYWRDQWHLEYFINGRWVRTIDRFNHSYRDPGGKTVNHTTSFNAIDKFNYTNGTGLSKPMHIIINMEQQSWLTDLNIIPTSQQLQDSANRNIYWLDWIRVYNAWGSSGGNDGGGNTGGGDTGGGDTGGGNTGGGNDLPYSNSGFSITRQTRNWSSGVLDISGDSDVDVSLSIEGTGPMENSDYLNVYYKLNGGGRVAISRNTNAFSRKTVRANNLSGNTLEIIVEGKTSYHDETYTVSNIQAQ